MGYYLLFSIGGYRGGATLELNLTLLTISFLVLISLIYLLSQSIIKEQGKYSTFVLVNIDEFDIKNMVEQSTKLADNLRNLSIISVIMGIFGALLISYFDILKRYKAIENLRESYSK